MKKLTKLTLIVLTTFMFMQCANDDDSPEEVITVTDADGNVYNTITIGNQTWMLENLKTTSYNDGMPITEYTYEQFGNNWLDLHNPKAFYRWADTGDLNNVYEEELPFDYYGAMYNHLAIESGKLAPEGWRIPSQQDFIELENYLISNGFTGSLGMALKSNSGWMASSGNGSDAIGFNGLPNGFVNPFGVATLAEGACFWATTDVNTANFTRVMISLTQGTTIDYMSNTIQHGVGIRCIKE